MCSSHCLALSMVFQTCPIYGPPDLPYLWSSRPALSLVLQTCPIYGPPELPYLWSFSPTLSMVLQTCPICGPPDLPCLWSSRPALSVVLQCECESAIIMPAIIMPAVITSVCTEYEELVLHYSLSSSSATYYIPLVPKDISTYHRHMYLALGTGRPPSPLYVIQKLEKERKKPAHAQ